MASSAAMMGGAEASSDCVDEVVNAASVPHDYVDEVVNAAAMQHDYVDEVVNAASMQHDYVDEVVNAAAQQMDVESAVRPRSRSRSRRRRPSRKQRVASRLVERGAGPVSKASSQALLTTMMLARLAGIFIRTRTAARYTISS